MRSAVDALMVRLEHEGFLPYAFCVDPAREGKRCYAGSSALTGVFCAEALAGYIDHSSAASVTTQKQPTLHAHICLLARTACRDIGPELHQAATEQIERTTDGRITSLAYEFHEALYESGKVVPPDIIEQLSLANLYGWMAYKVYDDALDDDGDDVRKKSHPSLIPCANFFLRQLAGIYSALGARVSGIGTLFDKTMNCIDDANAWEQKYCRVSVATAGTISMALAALPPFGDRSTLADRSIGHAMGPLAALLLVGHREDSEEYKNVESFFRHYLIARQVHDDAHDWADDLARDCVNSVGALVLARFKEKHSDNEAARALTVAMPELRTLFWEETIGEAASIILFHVAEARRARRGSSILDGADFMESALRNLESGARRGIKERDEVLVFLKYYKTSPPSGAHA